MDVIEVIVLSHLYFLSASLLGWFSHSALEVFFFTSTYLTNQIKRENYGFFRWTDHFFFPQKPLENRWSYLNQTNTSDQNHATGWMAQGWVYLTSSQGCGFLGSSDDNESSSIVGDSVQSLGWEICWRRNWQPTPVFLPGGFHGQRSLVGYYPWGCRQLDTTEQLTLIKDVGKTISLTMG